jgi:hypothetical protein
VEGVLVTSIGDELAGRWLDGQSVLRRAVSRAVL